MKPHGYPKEKRATRNFGAGRPLTVWRALPGWSEMTDNLRKERAEQGRAVKTIATRDVERRLSLAERRRQKHNGYYQAQGKLEKGYSTFRHPKLLCIFACEFCPCGVVVTLVS